MLLFLPLFFLLFLCLHLLPFFVLNHAHKGRTDDTSRYRYHGYTDQADDTSQQLAQWSDGINITVTYRCKGDDGLPNAVTDVFKHIGLGIPLDVIHEDGRETDGNETGCIGRNKFLSDGIKSFPNQTE